MRVRVAQGLIVCVCLAFVGLAGRLVYIQSQMRPQLTEWVERRQMGIIPLPGCRGTILDRRHRVLAGSQNRPTVYADPSMLEDRAEVAQALAAILDPPLDDLRKLLDKPPSSRFVVVQRSVNATQVDAIRKLRPPIPGLGIMQEPARTYPMEGLAAHILGFVGADRHGLEGVELACEKYLRDKPGQRTVYYDAKRSALFQAPDSYVPPRDGLHVILTIDSAIQEIIERQLSGAVEKFQAESGVAILMHPQTGEILGMASYPSFFPASAAKVTPDARRNRALTDPVEPGSVFKPFVMAAALSAGVTRPDEMINCQGGVLMIGNRRLHDSHPHGLLTAAHVVAQSSNIGMAIIGMRLGNKRMHDYLANLGYGKLTGIDLPGESPGLFMPLKAWAPYTTASVPMGHELAVTPIQLLTAFSTLVNGGRLMQPRLVAAIVDQEGKVVEDRSAPVCKGQVVEPHVAAMMHSILVLVVNEGTGRACQLDRWQVMGKTGTAQVPRKDRRGYEEGAYLSSFIAAVPASDPQLACLVMIRKPNRKIAYYGSQVSAPVVKSIFEQVLPYLNVPPDKEPPRPRQVKVALTR